MLAETEPTGPTLLLGERNQLRKKLSQERELGPERKCRQSILSRNFDKKSIGVVVVEVALRFASKFRRNNNLLNRSDFTQHLLKNPSFSKRPVLVSLTFRCFSKGEKSEKELFVEKARFIINRLLSAKLNKNYNFFYCF